MPIIPITNVINGLSTIPNVFDPDGLRSFRPDVDHGRPTQVSGGRAPSSVATDTVVAEGSRYLPDSGPRRESADIEELIDLATDEELLAAENEVALGVGPVRLEEIKTRGIDALAWYVPFHTRHEEWGIHIPISNVALFASQAFSSVVSTPSIRWKLALRALHQHELNHFAVEYFTAVWELLHGERTFFPSWRQLRNKRHGYIVLEERLANAQMIRSIRTGGPYTTLKGKTEALHDFIRRQPSGYCHARHSTADSKFFPLIQRVLRDRIKGTRAFSPTRHDQVLLRTLVDEFPNVDWRECPTYLYDDRFYYGHIPAVAWFIDRLQPSIEESRQFSKSLDRLDRQIADRWQKTKKQLLETTALDGLDFKKWTPGGKGAYSVRVSHGFRAHLRFQSPLLPWVAEDIGDHKTMGHG